MILRQKKRSKRGGKTRRQRRNQKRRNNRAVITHVKGSGFSDIIYSRLTYVDAVEVAPVTAITEPYQFRGNGLYDPDVTSTGHQPMYFDQYAAIYRKYRVLASKIHLEVLNQSSLSGMYFCVYPSTDAATINTLTTVLEQPRAKVLRAIPVGTRVSHNIRMYASTSKVIGIPKTGLNDDVYASETTGNPANQWYWNMLVASSDLTSPATAQFLIVITYYVQWFDRREATPS